jgi:hypothetical protein
VVAVSAPVGCTSAQAKNRVHADKSDGSAQYYHFSWQSLCLGMPAQVTVCGKLLQIDATAAGVNQSLQGCCRVFPCHLLQPAESPCMSTAAYGWKDIEHASAAERAPRRLIADDQPVAMGGTKRMITDQLHQPLVSRRYCTACQHCHARR